MKKVIDSTQIRWNYRIYSCKSKNHLNYLNIYYKHIFINISIE